MDDEKIAGYVNSAGYVQYWAGSLHTAILAKSEYSRMIAAQNLSGVIRAYKVEVPENLRVFIGIDVDKLEELASDILSGKR